MIFPHTKEKAAEEFAYSPDTQCQIVPGVQDAMERFLESEWEKEAESELACQHATKLDHLLLQIVKEQFKATRIKLSREKLYQSDYRRARRSIAKERQLKAAELADFYLPAAALLYRMKRDCKEEHVKC